MRACRRNGRHDATHWLQRCRAGSAVPGLTPDSTVTAWQRRGRRCTGPGRSGAHKGLLLGLGRPRACQINLGFVIPIALYAAQTMVAGSRFWSAMLKVRFSLVKIVLGPVDTVLHPGTRTAPEEQQQEPTP